MFLFGGLGIFVSEMFVIRMVGVLCRSSNALYGFNAVFSVYLNNVFTIFTADSDFPLLWW